MEGWDSGGRTREVWVVVLQEGKGDRHRPASPARCRALHTPGRKTTEPALALTLWGAQWVVLK